MTPSESEKPKEENQIVKLQESAGKAPEEEVEEDVKRRRDWEKNNRLIRDAAIAYFRKNQKLPSNVELAELTGLGERTLYDHLDSLDFDKVFKYSKPRMMAYTDDVFLSVMRQALKGNSKAQTLFFTLIGFIQKNELLVSDETKSKLHELVYGKPEPGTTGDNTGTEQPAGTGDAKPPETGSTTGDNPAKPEGETPTSS